MSPLKQQKKTSRSSSSDSSALSNITVGLPSSTTKQPPVASSTPPTSVSDKHDSGGRAKRKRQTISYSLKDLSDAQLPLSTIASSRNVSGLTGRTLVDVEGDESRDALFDRKGDKTLDSDDDIAAATFPYELPPRPSRRPSVKNRLKNATKKAGSVLGKRGRDVFEAGKKIVGLGKERENEIVSPKQNKILKQLDMGKRGVLDELDLDEDMVVEPPRPAKKAKLDTKAAAKELAKPLVTGSMQKTSSGKQVKKWQTQGLYVGQEATDENTQGSQPKKLQKKRPGSADGATADIAATTSSAKPKSFMPLPMFKRLEQEKEFKIPFDIFAPSATNQDKPKDWRQLNRNRLIGEAKDLWEKEDRLPASACVCPVPPQGQQGCEDDCLNRVMQYECNQDNCNLSAEQCSNRAFAELAARTKKGGKYDVGVEVVKTDKRGFGIRSCRSFRPGQIIMEYTGEIISEAECQRRMREDYKDKPHYYLMELERNLVIDGTKGSMARFINHSCEPNCEVRMVKVGGIPRMGVFAGNIGIMTGEELTYDYNFDNFGETQQKCYCGAQSCRGTLSKRLNAAEQKKQAKIELERKRKAAAEMQKHAEEEERNKKIKTDRGSSWRGWVAVDDIGVKEKLKEEKRAKEEAEMNSSRARRAAARRQSLPAETTAKKASPRRRRTTTEFPVANVSKPKHKGRDDTIEDAQPGKPSPEPRTRKSTELDEQSFDAAPEIADSANGDAEPPKKKYVRPNGLPKHNSFGTPTDITDAPVQSPNSHMEKAEREGIEKIQRVEKAETRSILERIVEAGLAEEDTRAKEAERRGSSEKMRANKTAGSNSRNRKSVVIEDPPTAAGAEIEDSDIEIPLPANKKQAANPLRKKSKKASLVPERKPESSDDGGDDVESPPKRKESPVRRRKHLRTTSTGSKFREELHPSSRGSVKFTGTSKRESTTLVKKTSIKSTTSTKFNKGDPPGGQEDDGGSQEGRKASIVNREHGQQAEADDSVVCEDGTGGEGVRVSIYSCGV